MFSCKPTHYNLLQRDISDVVKRGVTYRDIAINFEGIIDLADENAHQQINRYGGDYRCGNCLGCATSWHLNAYQGSPISLEGVCYY